MRRESQQRRVREKAHQRGLTSNYLEGEYEDDDEEAISIAAIKNRFKPGATKGKIREYERTKMYAKMYFILFL